MLLKKITGFTFLFLFVLSVVFGQSEQYVRGAIFDEDAYNSLPRKAALATRAYEGLPRSVSLKQYAPLPGDQANYGTCVAWASAYAARTISESVALDRRSQTETTQNVFSPVHVYRNIQPNDRDLQRGAQIHWALDLMRDSGAVRMLDVERSSDFRMVDPSLYRESRRYPIAGYVTLFSRDDAYKPGLVTRTVKKSLAEGKPVIIGMNTPESFFEAKDVWEPGENPEYFYGGHAMCVIGYDDGKNGGSFEFINSWGRKWGNGGYMWVPYRFFVDFVFESYEMIENLAVYSDAVKFSGFSRVEISGPEPKTAALVVDPEGYYKTADVYTEGTQFRFVIGAGESAYVYSFAVSRPARDGNFYTPVLLFPQAGVSPLLNYRDSTVILPGEDKSFALDAEAGTEYMITLYAKQPLDIQAVMRRFAAARGSLGERLSAATGSSNPLSVLSYDEREAAFTAEPNNPRAVAAFVVAIEHR
jgi:hypothetical protein